MPGPAYRRLLPAALLAPILLFAYRAGLARDFTSEDFLILRRLGDGGFWQRAAESFTGPWLGASFVPFFRPFSSLLLAERAGGLRRAAAALPAAPPRGARRHGAAAGGLAGPAAAGGEEGRDLPGRPDLRALPAAPELGAFRGELRHRLRHLFPLRRALPRRRWSGGRRRWRWARSPSSPTSRRWCCRRWCCSSTWPGSRAASARGSRLWPYFALAALYLRAAQRDPGQPRRLRRFPRPPFRPGGARRLAGRGGGTALRAAFRGAGACRS